MVITTALALLGTGLLITAGGEPGHVPARIFSSGLACLLGALLSAGITTIVQVLRILDRRMHTVERYERSVAELLTSEMVTDIKTKRRA